jgi:hypothetical protein
MPKDKQILSLSFHKNQVESAAQEPLIEKPRGILDFGGKFGYSETIFL